MGGKKPRSVLHVDPRLLPRVRDLVLKQNKYPDELVLVEELQSIYPEYARKKANVLKLQVRVCLETIGDEDSGPENMNVSQPQPMELESVPTFFIDKQPASLMNNSLSGIYKQQSEQKKPQPENNRIEQEILSPEKRLFNTINDEGERMKKRKILRKSRADDGEKDAQTNIDKLLEKQAKSKSKYLVEPTHLFENFAGLENVENELKRAFNHFIHPEISLYSEDYKGVLIQGPPGVGKSAVVEAMAKYLNVPLLRTTIASADNAEKTLNEVFELAKSMAPAIIFLDKLDFVCAKAETTNGDKDKTVMSHLIRCFEALLPFNECKLMVVGATTKLDKLEVDIKNLFEVNVKIDLPNEAARAKIAEKLFSQANVVSGLDFLAISQRTPGFVARDYKNVLKTAKHFALERIENIQLKDAKMDTVDYNENAYSKESKEIELILKSNDEDVKKAQTDDYHIEREDIEKSLAVVQPIFKSEGFATIPKVSWNDIGALKSARELLKLRILDRVRHAQIGNLLCLNDPVGILMYGPPGCGKTLLAKAIANEADINFISVRGPELLNKYVGESEKAVRELFARANHSKPCLIFFDEFDAISKAKSDSENNATTNVVKQLLTEMDGFNARSCFMLAATNRPDLIDPAIMRPGRFGKGIYIGFPEPDERVDILRAITKQGTAPKCAKDVDFVEIGMDKRLEGFSGADLKEFVTIASEAAFKEMIEKIEKDNHCHMEELFVCRDHFLHALQQVRSSLSVKERKAFEKLRIEFEQRSKA